MLCQAEASPQDSLTYQWYFNSQLIPEATEHTFEKYAPVGGRVVTMVHTENVARGAVFPKCRGAKVYMMMY